MKGIYDTADDTGKKIVAYITVMEELGSVFKCLAWLCLFILSYTLTDLATLWVGFATAAIASLLIMTERFKALNYNR